MPQSERLSAHALLEEVENNPILRRRFIEIIIKELNEESDLKGCIVGVVNNRISCIEANYAHTNI